MQRHAADGFAVLGVNTDKDAAMVKERCAKEGVTWANIIDGAEKKISRGWGVSGYPSAWLIDRDGVIRNTFLGIDPKELDAAVEELMKDKAQDEPAPQIAEKGETIALALETRTAKPAHDNEPACPWEAIIGGGADLRFKAPVQLKAGDKLMGDARLFPSPVYQDMNGDGLADVVIGDLPGRLTVALRQPGTGPAIFGAEEKLKAIDGKEVDFHNW